MRYQAKEDPDFPDAWIVEALDLAEGDLAGRVVFYGFEARERAEAYAAEKNAALGPDAPGSGVGP